MILDPTTDIGKLRLRVADYSDLPVFPDAVYTSVLADNNNNLPRSARILAQYILGALTGQTHQKLERIEVFGGEWYTNYLSFLKTTILNPNLWELTPLPYTPITTDEFGNKLDVPLIQFQKDWQRNYYFGTSDQLNHLTAQLTPTYPGFDGVNYF